MPSIKTLLMPALSQRLLSRERLLALRTKAEKARVAQGLRHVVHYFHQVDDPYSALAAACLPALAARYDVDIQAHVVGPPPDNAAPRSPIVVSSPCGRVSMNSQACAARAAASIAGCECRRKSP